MFCGKNHTLADIFLHHLTWFEISHDLKFLADQFLFVWIEFSNTWEDLTIFTVTSVKTEAKQFVWTFDFFYFFNFSDTDFNLVKVIKFDLVFFRLKFNLFWVPFLLLRFACVHLRLDIGNLFIHVQTWEDWSSFWNDCHIFWESWKFKIFKVKRSWQSELFHDGIWSGHHEWLDEVGNDTKTSSQVSHNSCQLFLVTIFFCKDPWSCFINILIGTWNDVPNGVQGTWEIYSLHLFVELFDIFSHNLSQISIKVYNILNIGRYLTTEILVDHGNCTVEEVSKVVSQFVVNTSHIVFWCEGAIWTDWKTTHEVVTEWIKTKTLYQHFWIDHVSLRLRHLTVFHDEPTVGNKTCRQWQIKSHKDDWPVDWVETKDILTNHVDDFVVFIILPE